MAKVINTNNPNYYRSLFRKRKPTWDELVHDYENVKEKYPDRKITQRS